MNKTNNKNNCKNRTTIKHKGKNQSAKKNSTSTKQATNKSSSLNPKEKTKTTKALLKEKDYASNSSSQQGNSNKKRKSTITNENNQVSDISLSNTSSNMSSKASSEATSEASSKASSKENQHNDTNNVGMRKKQKTTTSPTKSKEGDLPPSQCATNESSSSLKSSSNINSPTKSIQRKKPLNFRIFFPIVKNQSYPVKKDDKFSDLFVVGNKLLPKSFEVDILNQMFDTNSLYCFKNLTRIDNPNKDLLQILFIKKHLRKLTNIHHGSVEFFAIEQVEDLSKDDEQKVSYKLVELNVTQAISKIKLYLKNKASKLPKEMMKSIDTNPFSVIKKCTMSTFKSVYTNKDLLKKPNKTDHYLVIHSLCEGFDFIVYDQSHKLRNGVPIHQSLKIRLSFPPFLNMFIILNRHTAHCDAAAIEEESLNSFSFQNSFRLLSYVSKSSEGISNTNQKRLSRKLPTKKI